jgi:SAM-dependent methyltransferase
MDKITQRVSDMYSRFPYPSPEKGKKKLKELSNLLTIFSRETGYDFRNKKVLDAGTGTGHRLMEAAAAFKETSFLAMDVSDVPLTIAREIARGEGIGNVEFRRADIMSGAGDFGEFDVILCMGVLHHLPDPKQGLANLVRHLTDRGLLFLYIYGEHGSRERMRRKAVISLLLGGDGEDFRKGIRLVKELGFDSLSYGWNLNVDDEKTRESLFVDSYLNVNERLFDAESIISLAKGSGLDAVMNYGITVEQNGYLFESGLNAPQDVMLQRTEIAKKLTTPFLRERYEQLSIEERYSLIDLLFQPNGYTVVGLKEGAKSLFKPQSRVLRNLVRLSLV